ncbi:hypothetical protein IT570_12865 [Candidatus Sumerlaeota bacterium]|nr:hypothetical protein [Candidatus Sumerlaeota bacterium]
MIRKATSHPKAFPNWRYGTNTQGHFGAMVAFHPNRARSLILCHPKRTESVLWKDEL